MSDPKKSALPAHVLLHVSQQIQISLKALVATIELLDDGGTVPFIARYRKEQTGNLDEVQIRLVEEKLNYFRELEDRRATVLASIEEQGKLTPELKARIEATLDKSELEDLYLPFKPKRRTKATIARDKGLAAACGFSVEPGVRTDAARRLSPRRSSTPRRAWPARMRRWKARATSSPKRSARTADFRKALREMMMDTGTGGEPEA